MSDHHVTRLERFVAELGRANTEASYIAVTLPDGEERDHMMQAHFRLTEAVAHMRVVLRSVRARGGT